MQDLEEILHLRTANDALSMMRDWLRLERQRLRWTQSELSRRSGVPSSTISRFEITGLASTDSLMKILFAMNRLDSFVDYLEENRRRARLPVTLRDEIREFPVKRVRHRKGEK